MKKNIKEIVRRMKKELVIKKREQPQNAKPANKILYEMRYK